MRYRGISQKLRVGVIWTHSQNEAFEGNSLHLFLSLNSCPWESVSSPSSLHLWYPWLTWASPSLSLHIDFSPHRPPDSLFSWCQLQISRKENCLTLFMLSLASAQSDSEGVVIHYRNGCWVHVCGNRKEQAVSRIIWEQMALRLRRHFRMTTALPEKYTLKDKPVRFLHLKTAQGSLGNGFNLERLHGGTVHNISHSNGSQHNGIKG